MCAAMAANKYSPGRGPEMDEKESKERLSEERLESSPEVDRALYKNTIIIIIIIIMHGKIKRLRTSNLFFSIKLLHPEMWVEIYIEF